MHRPKRMVFTLTITSKRILNKELTNIMKKLVKPMQWILNES